MNTKPQIYYNNKIASTPQASKRKKKASQMKTICTLKYREVIYEYMVKKMSQLFLQKFFLYIVDRHLNRTLYSNYHAVV